jgi:phosphatidylglycerophosphate synthase
MSHNTFIHNIVRPVVRLAAPTGVTPNQITTARLLTGLVAAACFAQGGRPWMSAGACVFVLSMLLDRADGELARQTGQMSEAGHKYDLIADCVASIATFIGLGLGVAQEVGDVGLWIGALAAFGIAALFFQLNVIKAAQVSGRSVLGGRLTVDPDDAMVFVPILVWCGLAWPMVIVAAIITPIASLAIGLLSMRRTLPGAPPSV